MFGVLKLYGRVAALAARRALQAWPLALALPVYAALVLVVLVFSMRVQYVGGILAGFGTAAVASSYLHFLALAVSGSRITWADVRGSFGARLWDVVSVLFAFFLINFLVGGLVRTMPKGPILMALIGLAMTVFFNPVPELLYQGRERSFSLLGAAARFISTYGLEWLFPNVILGLVLLAPSGILQGGAVGGQVMWLAQLFSVAGLTVTLLSIPLIYAPLILAFVHWAMIFRGLLFAELASGRSNRQQVVRDALGKTVVSTAMATDRWGIDDSYNDAQGKRHVTAPATRAAILAAMGAAASSVDAGGPTPSLDVRVVLAGQTAPTDGKPLVGPGDLTLEDGTTRTVDGALPADLPIGYHRLRGKDASETLLIVTPGRCHLPADLRTWGWAAQVYAARSQGSWGIGDLADLRRLARWSRQTLGAGVVMVNPLCAPVPVPPIEPSPYYPSSRRFRNPLYLRIEEIPGADALGPALTTAANAGRALNAHRRIDRQAVFTLKNQALEAIFDHFTGDPEFDRYWNEQGQALTQFATYATLAEKHGRDWRQWPAGFRRPDGAAVSAFVTEQARRVRFHAWMQWQIDRQLLAASREIAVVHDLPIGLDVAGADAWCWQDMLASGMSVGAPPDEFNARGQDWGLTPFIPHRLRAQGYLPFIQTIRAMLRHAGGLRIDHVMGLFRLFWIPHGTSPAAGTYVRTQADELLAIVDVESHRAQAFIVGEDLGTVEDGVREKLAAHAMLSYRLLYFEPGTPDQLPEMALSSVTTHDLATIAGVWTGSDVTDTLAAGLEPNQEGMRTLRAKLAKAAQAPETAAPAAAVEGTYRALAAAPSRILLATLDDAIAVAERPNMPGTTTTWPNWSLALPQTLEEIEQADLPRRVAAALGRPERKP